MNYDTTVLCTLQEHSYCSSSTCSCSCHHSEQAREALLQRGHASLLTRLAYNLYQERTTLKALPQGHVRVYQLIYRQLPDASFQEVEATMAAVFTHDAWDFSRFQQEAGLTTTATCVCGILP